MAEMNKDSERATTRDDGAYTTPASGRGGYTPANRGPRFRFRGSSRMAWIQRRRENDYLSAFRATLGAIANRPYYPRRRPWQVQSHRDH